MLRHAIDNFALLLPTGVLIGAFFCNREAACQYGKLLAFAYETSTVQLLSSSRRY